MFLESLMTHWNAGKVRCGRDLERGYSSSKQQVDLYRFQGQRPDQVC